MTPKTPLSDHQKLLEVLKAYNEFVELWDEHFPTKVDKGSEINKLAGSIVKLKKHINSVAKLLDPEDDGFIDAAAEYYADIERGK